MTAQQVLHLLHLPADDSCQRPVQPTLALHLLLPHFCLPVGPEAVQLPQMTLVLGRALAGQHRLRHPCLPQDPEALALGLQPLQ